MKYKFALFIGLLLILTSIIVILVIHKNSSKKEPETLKQLKPEMTIRNASKRTVTYWIKEVDSSQAFQAKTLTIGAIHRYQSKGKHEVTYKSDDEFVRLLLDANTPYVFRWDYEDFLQLYPGSHGRSDAEDLGPFVATPREVVEKMLDMVKIGENDVVYDLGCGDGRIVIVAAKKYKARGVGIEIDPQLIRECKEKARIAGVENLVTFIEQDVLKVDISTATVVTIYLLPEANELLRPKLESQLKPGVFVISHDYPIPGWDAKEYDYVSYPDHAGNIHALYLYRR